jgi:hypothetical protein
MTIWMVYFKDTNQGAYVVAPTCEAAKEAFQARYEAKRLLRALHVKNVNKGLFPETAVLSPHDPRLSMLGLSYAKKKGGAAQ